MSTQLILIRHGATAWNMEKRYCGWTDVGLSKEGKIQVRLLAKRLKKEKVDNVYSSDRIRALSTATLCFKQIKITKVPDLREMNFGVFEGLSYNQILASSYADIYKKWLSDPFSASIPKGEEALNFKRRVLKVLRGIVVSGRNKTIAIVAHGGVISMFVNSILKEKDFWKHIPGSASITFVEYKNNKPKLQLFNDIRHLKG
ncbi:MAG: histidine phosphatase family protein [Candidatus Omnitrophica bacterium]|nr:histidine phosphatase family protein [Candidatus Omnitrophota bacterium]